MDQWVTVIHNWSSAYWLVIIAGFTVVGALSSIQNLDYIVLENTSAKPGDVDYISLRRVRQVLIP